jgi:polar amino acid transport system substrate-binding protein
VARCPSGACHLDGVPGDPDPVACVECRSPPRVAAKPSQKPEVKEGVLYNSRCMAAAFGLACSLAVVPALAADQQFFNEAKPMFDNCGDPSLAKAQKEGITLGYSVGPPGVILDENTKEASGIDVEINKAVLDWLGVTNVKMEFLPFESLIPSLLSKRIDVIAADFHHNPERDKVISFSGPAFWYGPALVVAKGNPLGIKSYDDLKGKRVGVVTSAAADMYLQRNGITTTSFKDQFGEFTSLNDGRLDAVVEDDIGFNQYAKQVPDNKMEALWSIAPPMDLIHGGGYGMARFAIRKEDCSLRAAYTTALAELRPNGQVVAILKKYGLSEHNLNLPTP